ncbi:MULTISPECIES: hypothetical protein [unclassified Pseudomonas]|uniref:hypothetical protein n=1 Tax=unclassified Pseudomonas TaxID=196821 RepID=UPI001CBEEAFB|nr:MULTISPECIES: hypothetical protein [unclassified Pseudomonas]
MRSVSFYPFLSNVSKSACRGTEAATNAWNANYAGQPLANQAPIPIEVTQYPIENITNAAGRQMLSDHLALSAKTEGNVINTFSNQYGKFEVKESLFVGPSGKAANFQSTFQILDDGTHKLSTVIPLH